jgi:lipoprotein-anchoring transpeptidase ErfK/SrfK
MVIVPEAGASVRISVDKSHQRMSVMVDGEARYHWAVSTGRAGHGTPSGIYRPRRLARTWFSRAYYNSPMPHSIFFHGGYAIHGSYAIRRLGGPASHGCIRLHPANAATLFALVQREGAGNTRIEIYGDSGSRAPHRASRRIYGDPVDDDGAVGLLRDPGGMIYRLGPVPRLRGYDYGEP